MATVWAAVPFALFFFLSLIHPGFSAVVDIFNAATGQWAVASLSAARSLLAAASLPEQGLAVFAGGAASSGEMAFFQLACCYCLCKFAFKKRYPVHSNHRFAC